MIEQWLSFGLDDFPFGFVRNNEMKRDETMFINFIGPEDCSLLSFAIIAKLTVKVLLSRGALVT